METVLALIKELNLAMGGTETGTAPLLVAGGIVAATAVFVTFCFLAVQPLKPLFRAAGIQKQTHSMKGVRESSIRDRREPVVARPAPSPLRRPLTGHPNVIAVQHPGRQKKNWD